MRGKRYILYILYMYQIVCPCQRLSHTQVSNETLMRSSSTDRMSRSVQGETDSRHLRVVV